jgi:hypothetical protein
MRSIKIKSAGGGFAPVARKVELSSEDKEKLEFRKDLSNYKLRQSRAATLENEDTRTESTKDPDLTFFIVKTKDDIRTDAAKKGFTVR